MARLAILLSFISFAAACATTPAPPPRARIEVETGEARAVLRIAEEQAARGRVDEEAWTALFATEGYRELKRREESLGRAFTDAEFRTFATSENVVARRGDLRRALDEWSRADLQAGDERALRYLPGSASITAIVHPLIKPKPNSFVHRTDRGHAIFLYLDPGISAAKFENIVVHELHHIGYTSSCGSAPPSTPNQYARAYTGGFGEGYAMLAAAGDAATHPHATSDDAELAVWERDIEKLASDMRRLEEFFLEIASGRFEGEGEMNERAMAFIATEEVPQGAFYTVGWHMASTIEKARGRDALVAVICESPEVMALYNEVVAGTEEPRWSQELLDALTSGPTSAG
jgi:hypothetical protein